MHDPYGTNPQPEMLRWSAKIDGKPKSGTVQAFNAREAAEAWAEQAGITRDECEVEVTAVGSETSETYTVECEVEVSYHAFRVHGDDEC
jgi:hypothetical protein